MRTDLLVTILLVSGVATAAPSTVGVLAVDAHGLSAGEVETLGDAVATVAHELLPGRVLGPAEVRELVKKSGVRVAKRCKSKRCWMKVGKAAELDAVLAVRAVANKRGVALSFKWVDLASQRVTARHQQPIRKDMLTFAEDTTEAMQKLRQKLEGGLPAAPPPVAAVAPPPPAEPEPAPPEPAPAPPAPTPEPAPAGGTAVAASTTVAMAAPAAAPAAAQPPAPAATTTARPAVKVWLGLALGRGSGAVVNRVAAGGPGASAGLQNGDVIQEWDGWVITTAKDVMGFAARTGPGRSARIKVSRGGAVKMMSITPEEPADGAEPDDYQVADVGGPPPSSLPLRPAESAPPGWLPPEAQQKRK